MNNLLTDYITPTWKWYYLFIPGAWHKHVEYCNEYNNNIHAIESLRRKLNNEKPLFPPNQLMPM